MPATCTPLGACAPLVPPIAPVSIAPKLESEASCRTTSRRRYGWPFAPCVVCALARFPAVTSIRRRSAERPLPATSIASKRPISARPSRSGGSRCAPRRPARAPGTRARSRRAAADSWSGSTPLPSGRITCPLSTVGEKAMDSIPPTPSAAWAARSVAWKSTSLALVAGRVDVREVVREQRLTQRGTAHGGLEGELGGVEQAHAVKGLRGPPWRAMRSPPWGTREWIGRMSAFLRRAVDRSSTAGRRRYAQPRRGNGSGQP